MKLINICAIIALSGLFSMASYADYFEQAPGTRLTPPPKLGEAKWVAEIKCISQKTGEKKSTWMYQGLGSRIVSNKEVCSKHFGEDFEDEQK